MKKKLSLRQLSQVYHSIDPQTGCNDLEGKEFVGERRTSDAKPDIKFDNAE